MTRVTKRRTNTDWLSGIVVNIEREFFQLFRCLYDPAVYGLREAIQTDAIYSVETMNGGIKLASGVMMISRRRKLLVLCSTREIMLLLIHIALRTFLK